MVLDLISLGGEILFHLHAQAKIKPQRKVPPQAQSGETLRLPLLLEQKNENINSTFPRVGTESITGGVSSRTLVPLHYNWPNFIVYLQNLRMMRTSNLLSI